MTRHLVPANPCRIELRVSNSRFIATIDRANSAADAHAFVRKLRKEFPDANHHVYAFRIGHGGSITEGMSDDGEPSGTAGPPSMAVLRGSGIGDVVLVTTRFFGGTKLGTGGLVTAYTRSAQEAFAALESEEKIHRVSCEIQVPYDCLARVRIKMDAHQCLTDLEDFGEKVSLRIRVADDQFESLRQAILDATAGRVSVQLI